MAVGIHRIVFLICVEPAVDYSLIIKIVNEM